MNKRGFTLSEVLIAVGVVGILAAITLPMANKFKPDTTKISYLRTYDAISSITNMLVKNEELFPSFTGSVDYTKYPLANIAGGVTTFEGSSVSRNSKRFCEALAIGFNKTGTPSCKTTSADYGNDAAFTTTNGIAIRVVPDFPDDTTNYERFFYRIEVDVDGFDNGNNCTNIFIRDIESCPNPDRFVIYVKPDGTIIPADRSGMAYLDTRTNTKYQEYSSPSNSAVYSYLRMSEPSGSITKSEFYIQSASDPMWQFNNWIVASKKARVTLEESLQDAMEQAESTGEPAVAGRYGTANGTYNKNN